MLVGVRSKQDYGSKGLASSSLRCRERTSPVMPSFVVEISHCPKIFHVNLPAAQADVERRTLGGGGSGCPVLSDNQCLFFVVSVGLRYLGYRWPLAVVLDERTMPLLEHSPRVHGPPSKPERKCRIIPQRPWSKKNVLRRRMQRASLIQFRNKVVSIIAQAQLS